MCWNLRVSSGTAPPAALRQKSAKVISETSSVGRPPPAKYLDQPVLVGSDGTNSAAGLRDLRRNDHRRWIADKFGLHRLRDPIGSSRRAYHQANKHQQNDPVSRENARGPGPQDAAVGRILIVRRTRHGCLPSVGCT